MTKYVVAQNGVVINIVTTAGDNTSPTYYWPVPDAQAVSVGDVFDVRNYLVTQVSNSPITYAMGQALFNHENRLRDLVRSVWAISSAAASGAGLPNSSQSGDITAAQFVTGIAALLSSASSAAYIPPQNFYQ